MSLLPSKLYFPSLVPKQRAYFHAQQMALLGFFLPPYAAPGIQTQVSRFSPRPWTFWRTLYQLSYRAAAPRKLVNCQSGFVFVEVYSYCFSRWKTNDVLGGSNLRLPSWTPFHLSLKQKPKFHLNLFIKRSIFNFRWPILFLSQPILVSYTRLPYLKFTLLRFNLIGMILWNKLKPLLQY